MHADCLQKTNAHTPNCATCNNPLNAQDFVILHITDKYEGERDCPACQESIITTARRLHQDIIVRRDGQSFHQECFKEAETDILRRFPATSIVHPPQFKTWAKGEKQRIDPDLEDDAALARQLAAQHQYYMGPVGGFQPDDDCEPIVQTVGMLLLGCSALAFVFNAFKHFSNPLLHLFAIPFYFFLIAGICQEIYKNCVVNPN